MSTNKSIDLESYWNDPDGHPLDRGDALDVMTKLTVPLHECEHVDFDPTSTMPGDFAYKYYFEDGRDGQPWWRSIEEVEREELVDAIAATLQDLPAMHRLEADEDNARQRGLQIICAQAHTRAYDADRFLALLRPSHDHPRWKPHLRDDVAARIGRRPLQLEQFVAFCEMGESGGDACSFLNRAGW